ncbi:MAG TPA: HlyD family efflux transporter periplasmic adaptor subunit [Bacteroidales bacterium]|jgi:HlyD family secretion protein|nr:HlyD family efflux transporter periplasmic adaptor subunit [Bacteroidales bacterium]
MPEIVKHEIRSPELQEVMSEIPGRFLRWGLFLFFAIIVAILGVTWFINYPDVVTAPVTITTYNSPAPLTAKSGGLIEKLTVDNGEDVSTDQPVAIIENTAQYDDILVLVAFLDTLEDNPGWQDDVKKYSPPEELSLGEVQTSYSRFLTYFFQFREYLRQSYINSKLKLLDHQIRKQHEYTDELLSQEKLSAEDLDLVLRSYERDSVLYYSNLHSVTLSEYERSKQALIQKKSAHSSLRASITNNESSALKMKESRLDLLVQLDKELHQYKLDLDDSFRMLSLAIDQWKEKYLIKSPVKGRITFTSYWNINQVIKAGEILATVVPDDPSRIIARANVPVSGLGKVKTGQEVNIKLSGFPYMEYGVLKGKISTLSLVPAGEYYIAEIDLVNGLRSTYGINLGFINEMTGTADIITDNSRLIFRLIKPLRSVFK